MPRLIHSCLLPRSGPVMWPCKTNTSSWSEVQWLYGKTVPNQNVIATGNTHSIHHPNASAILAIVRNPT